MGNVPSWPSSLWKDLTCRVAVGYIVGAIHGELTLIHNMHLPRLVFSRKKNQTRLTSRLVNLQPSWLTVALMLCLFPPYYLE